MKSVIQPEEWGIPITIEIRNPSSTDKESVIQYMLSGIHGVESRVEDCLVLFYTRRDFGQFWEWKIYNHS